jgi:hypothetical protein
MLQRLGVANPKHILQRFLEKRCPKLYPRKRLQRLPTKKMLLFLLLQLFWAYCNTFRALKQGQNLVVLHRYYLCACRFYIYFRGAFIYFSTSTFGVMLGMTT